MNLLKIVNVTARGSQLNIYTVKIKLSLLIITAVNVMNNLAAKVLNLLDVIGDCHGLSEKRLAIESKYKATTFKMAQPRMHKRPGVAKVEQNEGEEWKRTFTIE